MTSQSLPASAPAAARPASRRTVDAPIRMFHALFVLSFAGAYLSGDGERWRALHVTLGYTMLGLLGLRIVYGLVGPRPARLSALWRKLAGGPVWLRSLISPPTGPTGVNWRQGQNLLMALAVALLMALVLPTGLSGLATYQDWGTGLSASLGDEWLAELHEFFGNLLLAVVLVHLALIAGLSLLRRKNQALPMLTGRSEGKGPDLVQHNRAWLAALLLLAVLGWGAWQWQQSPDGLLPGAGTGTGTKTPTGVAYRRSGGDD